MIIIETTKGPHMINERETIGCSFDKAKGEAIVTYNRDPREVVSFHEGIPISRTEYPSRAVTIIEAIDEEEKSKRKGEVLGLLMPMLVND